MDDRIRELERRAKQGDPQARAAVRAAKVRYKAPPKPRKKYRKIIELVSNKLEPGQCIVTGLSKSTAKRLQKKYIRNKHGKVSVRELLDGSIVFVLADDPTYTNVFRGGQGGYAT